MAAEHRKLLEQLMGSQVLSGPGGHAPQVKITDPKVCRSYLVGTCPHDLFTNTKQDIGICKDIHSESLKAEYEAADDAQKRAWGFEFDYLRDMGKYVDECNRRIDGAQKRLEKTPDEIRQHNALLEQIADVSETIACSVHEVDVLIELREVNKAYQEFYHVRVALQQKAELEQKLKALSDTSGPSGHQKLQVCDVCGAYLSRLDNDRRLADHFFGKMHLGYAQMRKTYETLQKELKGRHPPPRQEVRESRDGGRADNDGGYGGDRGYGRNGGYRNGGGYGRGGGFRGGRGRW